MWELDGWDGLAANFAHETGGGRDQDPSLAEWWAAAASLRRGGVDRIVVPTPWTRSVEQLTADGVRGEVYAHELVTVPPGTSRRAARRGRARGPAPRSGRSGSSRRRLRGGHGRRLRGARCSGPSPTGRRGSPTSRPGRPTARWPAWRKTLLGLGASLAPPAARRLPAQPAPHRPPAPGVRPPPAGGDLMGERPPAVITDDGDRPAPGAHQRARAVAPAAAPPRRSPPTPSGTWPRPTATTTRCGAIPTYGATTRWGGPIAPPPLVGGDTLVGVDEVTEVPADQKALMKGDPLRGVHAFYAVERPRVVGAAGARHAGHAPQRAGRRARQAERVRRAGGARVVGPGVPRRRTARCCRPSSAT